MAENQQDVNKNVQDLATATNIMFFPAPIDGLNLRDSSLLMNPTDAIVMDNWISNGSWCYPRKGYTQIIPKPQDDEILTVAWYDWKKANELIVILKKTARVYTYNINDDTFTLKNTYDIDDVKLPYKTLIYQKDLYFFNGKDSAYAYDGNGFLKLNNLKVDRNRAISTPPQSALRDLVVYNNRLLCYFSDYTDFDSSGVNIASQYLFFAPIGMSLYEANTDKDFIKSIRLTDYLTLGGRLNLLCTWTRDTADNTQNQIVVGSNNGEIFRFTDELINDLVLFLGVRKIARIVDGRNWCHLGDSLLILTHKGVINLADFVFGAMERPSFNNKIDRGISNISNSNKDEENNSYFKFWQFMFASNESMVFLNCPNDIQYVFSATPPGSWCRFTGLQNVKTFCVAGEKIIFCNDEGVHTLFTADKDCSGDNTTPREIKGKIQCSYTNMKTPFVKKLIMSNIVGHIDNNSSKFYAYIKIGYDFYVKDQVIKDEFRLPYNSTATDIGIYTLLINCPSAAFYSFGFEDILVTKDIRFEGYSLIIKKE